MFGTTDWIIDVDGKLDRFTPIAKIRELERIREAAASQQEVVGVLADAINHLCDSQPAYHKWGFITRISVATRGDNNCHINYFYENSRGWLRNKGLEIDCNDDHNRDLELGLKFEKRIYTIPDLQAPNLLSVCGFIAVLLREIQQLWPDVGYRGDKVYPLAYAIFKSVAIEMAEVALGKAMPKTSSFDHCGWLYPALIDAGVKVEICQ